MKYNVISKYVFEQSDTTTSKYFLKEIQGVELANFLDTAKKDNGKQNLRFAPPREDKDKGFDKVLIGKGRISGLMFSPLAPEKAHGDTKNPTMKGNDCLLLKFSDNNKHLSILVVKDMASQREKVFDDWLAGEVLEVVDSELLPINEKAASRKD